MSEIELNIISLAQTGSGVGTIEVDGHKRSVFIPFTCPGDRVKAKIIETHKKYYNAQLIEILKPSHLRTDVRCKHFEKCGGCNLLHIDYEAQVEYKKRLIAYTFKDFYNKEITTITGDPDFYRKKVRVFSDHEKVGFKKSKSNTVVDVKECYVMDKAFLQELHKFKKVPGEYILVSDDDGIAVLDTKDKVTINLIEQDKTPVAHYKLNGQDIVFSPGCFVQANTKLNEKLVNHVVSLTQKSSAKTILELFSGIGNFASQLKGTVKCIEGDAVSYFFSKHNAKNAKSVHKDVYAYVDEELNGHYDLILMDPPRDGLNKGYAQKLAKVTDTFIYVSCSPQSLKENLKEFVKLGFELSDLTLVDMFPHTQHVELVALITRKDDL